LTGGGGSGSLRALMALVSAGAEAYKALVPQDLAVAGKRVGEVEAEGCGC
jgi:hypothetical protein